MRKITRFELYTEVIGGMSARVKKKALREALNEARGLNDVLVYYYKRVHGGGGRVYEELVYASDFSSHEDFIQYIKDSYNAKRFKKAYNYAEEVAPVKQKDTGLFMGRTNGFYRAGSYVFDMYQYVDAQKIELID